MNRLHGITGGIGNGSGGGSYHSGAADHYSVSRPSAVGRPYREPSQPFNGAQVGGKGTRKFTKVNEYLPCPSIP